MGRPKGSKNGVHTLITVTCARCGKRFGVKPSSAGTARYCTMACKRPGRQEAVCETCGKTYLVGYADRGRFCSQKCMRKKVEKTCPQCGRVFSVKASQADSYNYCSLACKREASTSVALTCVHCGKQFQVNAARVGSARYCSYECRYAAGRITIICANCGKERTIQRYRAIKDNQTCCSNRCATLLRMKTGFEPGSFGEKRKTGYHTDIEKLTEQALIEIGIRFIFEHKVGRYSVDFALPDLGIALECDGWQHLTEEGRERDARRDACLTEEGWQVVHVLDRDIRFDSTAAICNALGIRLIYRVTEQWPLQTPERPYLLPGP